MFFSVSAAEFTPRNMPAELVPWLLRRNDELTTAAWTMDVDGDDVLLNCRYCVAPDALTPAFFEHICLTVVNEAAELDNRLAASGLI
jgi:hypothetical protein